MIREGKRGVIRDASTKLHKVDFWTSNSVRPAGKSSQRPLETWARCNGSERPRDDMVRSKVGLRAFGFSALGFRALGFRALGFSCLPVQNWLQSWLWLGWAGTWQGRDGSASL